MKVDFNKAGAPATPTMDAAPESQPQTSAVATRPANPAPAPYQDENIQMGDIDLPRLNIVQKVGELSNVFDGGTVLLNAEQVIYTCPKDPKAPAPTPLNILILGFQPMRYCEKVEGGGKGRICNFPEEVVTLGGTLDYNESKVTKKPLFQRLATALVLVEKPEDVDDLNFPHEFGGKKYCTALWNMKGSSYTKGAKTFFTARKIGKLRGPAGYRSAFYSFGTQLTSYDGNFYYIPVLKPGADTSEELRNWLASEVVGF